MELPKRKNTRLKNYDYSTPGAYFVTLCTHNRRCLFSDIVGAIHESPLHLHRSVISKVVGYLKMNSSRDIHKLFSLKEIWQRNFHDHIIRSYEDYNKIWEYIDTNALKWEQDCFYNND